MRHEFSVRHEHYAAAYGLLDHAAGIDRRIVVAVRHGGFIPWDDDVDVMFTRKNYEMFAKVVRRELPEDMSFVEPNEYHGGKAFYDFISRVTYNKSQKFEDSGKMEFYDDKISRLNVDLFIVDGLPEGKLAKKLTKLSHSLLNG